MTRILIVEDEESYREPLTYQLKREGYEVDAVANGPDALVAYDFAKPDLVLLDLMLPGLSGTEVCRELRKRGDVPVIMLTAKDSEIDKIVGLEIGADDYVTKPYSFRELLARMRAILRRKQTSQDPAPVVVEEDEEALLVGGPVTMNVERHVVTVRGIDTSFPLKEFELLEFLLRNVGRVLTRGQLIDRVWGSDYVGDTKTLDVHIKRIRAKIEQDPSTPQLVQTVRGLGYKYEEV
ncbi:response regulator transcription factor [Jonesiaceae bacterium BS-20]|uniref:Sensory transduction protein RegX3 n=1 Tax=Jonesiaceae bacterium BS-20 TaxID=3120821 RepID=A0AAU7DWC0_9MICO